MSVSDKGQPRQASVPRWVGPVFLAGGGVLIFWVAYLNRTLPQRQLSPNYRLAWVGFDVILLIQFARTGFYALSNRNRRFLAIPASATSALLIVDAWFDITTSPAGTDRMIAIALAVFAELPLAILCRWLAVRVETVYGAPIYTGTLLAWLTAKVRR